MRLTQLELVGFKSFVEPTTFSFSEGLTGIVGPNGCGKSNISDAIHWVLGEQTPRRLRANSMKDVIFKGTRKRAPHSYTEVSITLENNKKLLPIEYEDIRVTRKLYRDGESEFLINNKACRLKDILNLFYDTGMGRHAYSFMEQGMIEELLSSNDYERRYLFEEAAGIMKYNQSRKISENKLQSVKNDLTRLQDIIAEVKHQVGSLRHQVGKAKKYQNLKEKINKIQIQLAGIKFFNQQNKLPPLQVKFIKIEKKLTEIIKNISNLAQTFNQKNTELLSTEKNLREEQNALKKIEEKINNYEKKILLNRQQIANSKSALTENMKQIKKIEFQNATIKENLTKNIKILEQSKERLSTRINYAKEFEDKLNIIDKKIIDFNDAIRKLEKKINNLSSRKQALLKEKAEDHTKLSFLTKQKLLSQNKISTYQNKFEEISRLKTISLNSSNKHSSELKDFIEQKIQIETEMHELIHSENTVMHDIQKLELQIKSLKNEEQQLTSWEKNLVGYEIGTKKLIENFSKTKNLSTLGNQIEVNDSYASIIEKSLKSLISSAVCPKSEIGEVLTLLQNEKLNSNILIENTDNSKHNAQYTSMGEDNEAIPLTKLIKIKSKSINPKIFQNIYFVSDRKTAQKLANENAGSPVELRFITKDGEIFSNFGIVKTNWQQGSTKGILSRKKAIQNIQDEIQRKTIYVNELQEEAKKISSDKMQKSDELSALLKKINKLESLIRNERSMQIQQNIQFENLQNLLLESKNNLSHIQKEIDDIKNHQQQIDSQLASLPQNNNKDLLTRNQELHQKMSAAQKSKSEIVTELNNTKIDIARLEKDVYFFSENIQQNQRLVDENNNLIARLRKSINPQKEEIADLEKITNDLENKFRSELEQLNKYKAKTIKTENKFHILHSDIDKLKLSTHELEFKKDVYTEDKNNIELKIQEIKLNAKHIREDVFSHFHYELTHDEQENYANLSTEELNMELNKHQKALDNLGQINLAAIDDYNTYKKRLKFLTEQQEDIIHSQENLQKAIKELNATAEKMFMHTFRQVQQNFEKIFKEVFNGGKGKLRLADETRPLESKIDIFASPKGKKISTISLLSTGEKALTAIALLFAIYLIKPSPFCILDEIDAPLDDANVTRFLNLLNKFSQDTQFIIITHNKRTVEAVDYLYGITMEENGVSKIVSVNFS